MLGIAFKILADVAIYRLRRLEMANLFATVSIMLALSLPLPEAAVRLLFAVLLNLLVYLNNDYYDLTHDLRSQGRDAQKNELLSRHKPVAKYTQWGLAIALALIGRSISWGLVVTLVAAGGICWLYSSRLKRVAYLDVIAMLLAGMLMPLVAFPLDRTLGWCLVAQLGLFSACFQSIQIIRDHPDDLRLGVRTTAVSLGVGKTIFLLRLFIVLAALYAVLFLHQWLGLIAFVALLLPVPRRQVSTYWTRVRLVFGLCWLALVGWLFWTGTSSGLLSGIDREQTWAALSWIR